MNRTVPLHSLWDGFWIHRYRHKTLVVAGSFDRIYYRNVDVVFKDVSFFNLPAEWRDTWIEGDDLVRLSNPTEFTRAHPDVDVGDRQVFAIDIVFHVPALFPEPAKHTFFVLAKRLYVNECTPADNHPAPLYEDPADDAFPSHANRVPLLKRKRARPGK
ncbi:MAG: hypothetical protein U0271_28975 [Polyangiaceae bacterium]